MFLFKRKVVSEPEIQEAISVEFGQDTVVLGSLSVSGIREGNLFVKDTITITVDTHVVGEVIAKNCVIDGKVTGNIICADNLQLGETAVIDGEITTKRAVMESGCIVNGKVMLNKDITVPLLALKIIEAEKIIEMNSETPTPSDFEVLKKESDFIHDLSNKENQIIKKQKPAYTKSGDEGNSNWW